MKTQIIHILESSFSAFNTAVNNALAQGYEPMFPVSMSVSNVSNSIVNYVDFYSVFMKMPDLKWNEYKQTLTSEEEKSGN